MTADAKTWTITQCGRCGSSLDYRTGVAACASTAAWCNENPRWGREGVASGTPEEVTGEYRSEDLSVTKVLTLLDVKPCPGGSGRALLVDASKAMPSPHHVQYWHLFLTDDGEWTDYESDGKGTLGACLGAIALCYVTGESESPEGAS